MSVLIGTDEPCVADTLRTIISHTLDAGYDLRFTVKERGSQLRRAASLYDHGLVVLFINTMVLEGEGSLFDRSVALVRDLQGLSKAALIVITSMRPPGFATQMEQLGVDAMIDAPFDIPAMTHTIGMALECRQLRRDNESRKQDAGRPRDVRCPRILLRDDEPALLEVYSLLIRDRWPEATIVTCSGASVPREELCHHPPDLMITDLNHAGMSGYELLQYLAAIDARFPIIVLSASLPSREPEARNCAGPALRVSYLPKPATVEELLELITRLLG